ncbi:MAG: glycerate kinase type-2 family protein [Alkalispirochaetaceae bacterium]
MQALTRDQDLNQIITAALTRADPQEMIRRCLRVDGDRLKVETEGISREFDLREYESVLLIGAGKASGRMARAVEELLGEAITAGAVVTKTGHGEPVERVSLLEAGHPVPDAAGVEATSRIAEIADGAGERDLVISVISGGGSALLVSPYEDREHTITLEDMQETTELLLASGAAIQEINCLRKHLSGVKGGRLARRLAPATSINLILSDVVGDDLSSIASGITSPDPTTYRDAVEIAGRYGIWERLPPGVRRLLEAGAAERVEETPKRGSAVFERVHNIIIGSNAQALAAAGDQAERLGYNTVVLTATLTGEAREMAKFFTSLARGVAEGVSSLKPPLCILAGGETTVTLAPDHGVGGRNQELLLSGLVEALTAPELFQGTLFCSLATDGNDGPTDSAGGWFDYRTLAAADRGKLFDHLRRNDAYSCLEELGAHLRTGATNTNVCDIQILICR